MKNILVMVGAGAALLCATVGGLLVAQGRWDYEGTRHIPLLNRFFEAPDEPAPPVVPPHKLQPDKTTPGTSGRGPTRPGTTQPGKPQQSRPRTETADKPELERRSRETGQTESEDGPRSLFEFTSIEASGMTVAEVNAIVELAQNLKRELVREREELRKHRADLEVREHEVALRQERIAKLMEEVLEERARLESAIRDFNRRVVALPVDEDAALRRAASTIAKLTPEAGAELILDFWTDPGGRSRAIKILAVMNKDRADEILACFDTKRAREILEARMGVVRTDRSASNGVKETPR